MIILYHAGGARDFQILTPTFSTDEWSNLKRNACRLLEARKSNRAAEILRNSNFRVFDGTNGFGDEFCVLYKTLPIEQYVAFEAQDLNHNERTAYTQLAQTVSELGPYIRFIAVGIERGNGPELVAVPEPQLTSEVIERALSDSEELLHTRGATSAFDRLHTAIHGYFRAVCDDAQIDHPDDSTLTALFSLIRNNHPDFQNLGPRADDIVRILRSLSTVIDSINTLRNRTSVVHPNPELLEESEAMLVINCVRTIFHYFESKLQQN